MNRLGEWIGWALHYLLGLIAGGGLGVGLIYGRRPGFHSVLNSGLISQEVAFPFILGASLLGAGLGAWFGDRLWLSESYRIIAPEGPAHTSITKVASLASMVIGAAFIGYALYRQIFILHYRPIDF